MILSQISENDFGEVSRSQQAIKTARAMSVNLPSDEPL